MPTPTELVDAQLDAYNRRDLDAFCACFAAEVRVKAFPSGALLFEGAEAFRARYAARFTTEGLHAEVVRRVVKGAVVIDEEQVVGIEERPVHAVAMYHCGPETIAEVHFVLD